MDRDDAAELIGRMVRIARTLRIAGQRSDKNSLTGTKLGILRHLTHRSARLSDLAHHHKVSLPVVSRAVDALEADGMVSRRSDPDDARATLISISEGGRDYLTERQNRLSQRFADRLSHWSHDDVALASHMLEELTDCLSDVTDAAETSGAPPPDSAPTEH